MFARLRFCEITLEVSHPCRASGSRISLSNVEMERMEADCRACGRTLKLRDATWIIHPIGSGSWAEVFVPTHESAVEEALCNPAWVGKRSVA